MTSYISVKHLSKKFSQKGKPVVAIEDISFELEQGEVFGIIGQSGAGKSTLLRCLSSLEKPTSGEISIAGQDICSLEKVQLRAFRTSIGMIFQHFNLLSSRSVFANVELPLEMHHVPVAERQKRVDELLQIVGLTSKRDSYPSCLSGGEKQRVGIARALANNPKVLFCDEATSALDPKTTKEILSLLKRLNKDLGITILLITHEMDVVKQICHKVIVLDKGSIIERGSVAEIFSSPVHPLTKDFIQRSAHEIPLPFFKEKNAKLLKLYFKGSAAQEPIITSLIKKYAIEVNILAGWIDTVQNTTIGSLTVEIRGSEDNQVHALFFLKEHGIAFEELLP